MLKRIVVSGTAVVASGAVLASIGFAAATDSGKVAATSASAGAVATVVNRAPQSSASYWTDAARAAAKPMERTRSDAASQAFGTSGLDFTRSRITPQSANTQAPYKGVGKLFFEIPGKGNFQCSAGILSNRMIVTAAHCMYGQHGNGSRGFFTNWEFIPAYDGSKPACSGQTCSQRPHGTWDWTRGQIPQGFIDSQGTVNEVVNNFDFGILTTRDQSFDGGATFKTVFRRVGFKFTHVLGHLFDTHVTSLGYPCNLDACNIMQRNDSSDRRRSGFTSGNGSTAYEYGSDMTGGSSGGPWVENFSNPTGPAPTGSWATRNAIVGVTSYGYTDPNIKVQGASQFNNDFQNIYNASCASQVGNC